MLDQRAAGGYVGGVARFSDDSPFGTGHKGTPPEVGIRGHRSPASTNSICLDPFGNRLQQ